MVLVSDWDVFFTQSQTMLAATPLRVRDMWRSCRRLPLPGGGLAATLLLLLLLPCRTRSGSGAGQALTQPLRLALNVLLLVRDQ